jgi:phage-related protein (TIGR01555 family)
MPAQTARYTKKADTAARKIVNSRKDAWANPYTGAGITDKLSGTVFLGNCLQSEAELCELFRHYDLARTIVCELPGDALRLKPKLKVSVEDEDDKAEAQELHAKRERALAKIFQKHNVYAKYLQAKIWGRLYGLGAVVLVSGKASETPWEPGKGPVTDCFVAEGPELRVKSWYTDPMSSKFGLPAVYWLTRKGMGGVATGQIAIHESRMILCGGALTPSDTKIVNQGRDDSVITAAYEALKQAGSNWASVSNMIHDMSVAVYKLNGYIDALASEGESTMRRRFAAMDMQRAVTRCIAIDKEDEEFEYVERGTVSGTDKLIDKTFLRLAAAARMPVTKLLGQSPAGMNATGESDTRIWYDQVGKCQTDEMAPDLERLAKAFDPGAEWTIEFPSLWQETAGEKQTRLKTQADTDKGYVDSGILLPEEIAASRFGKGNEHGLEIDLETRQELLANAHEAALNPPDPVELARAEGEAKAAAAGKAPAPAKRPPA